MVCQQQHGGDHFGLLGDDDVTVLLQERKICQEESARVPVHKSVVLA
jgi:hypothetical protein